MLNLLLIPLNWSIRKNMHFTETGSRHALYFIFLNLIQFSYRLIKELSEK